MMDFDLKCPETKCPRICTDRVEVEINFQNVTKLLAHCGQKGIVQPVFHKWRLALESPLKIRLTHPHRIFFNWRPSVFTDSVSLSYSRLQESCYFESENLPMCPRIRDR